MMKAIRTKDWIPTDGLSLERNALSVAKGNDNRLVVAGPGAGKTELLAQKACFLLQTNSCKFPHKILAISFKRDAAYNLKERVKLRCGDELSKRFESLTFDSFAKQILDRFYPGLPKNFLISSEYDVLLDDDSVIDFYVNEDSNYVNTTKKDKIIKLHTALPLNVLDSSDRKTIRDKVWKNMVKSKPSKLSFKMIMRLAENILFNNPKIKEYLQQTYHFVFLDEFQDTTEIQYDFFKSCFLNSKSLFTAVGDDKQRIMVWAGAKDSIFEDFIADVSATRIPLSMNFRCAPRLVALLNYLSEHLLGKKEFALASPKWKPDQGQCLVWVFDNPVSEIQILFNSILQWISKDNVNPREICILVKQQLNKYAGDLIDFFNKNGIKTRDENKYQDLLTQEVSLFIIHSIYTVFDKKAKDSKNIVFNFLSNLHTEMQDDQLLRLEVSFSLFIKKLRKKYVEITLTEGEIKSLIQEIVTYANKDRIRAVYSSYKNINILNYYITALEEELLSSCKTSANIIKGLDKLLGIDTIPVMTIHKSKGLEYHTIIFIGLEDNAFWSFERQPDEDKCAFFVALSRAKERAVFTFSKQRQGRYKMENQTIDKIKVLFNELKKSGIVIMHERKI